MQTSWTKLYSEIDGCTKCRLCEGRHNIVVGVGNKSADIMFIGEGPGHDEDMQGVPFVGRAGQLLDRMLAAIDLTREDVYIANIVKCRPPSNRNPEDDEAEACIPYLREQFALVRPKLIVCLGSVALRHILGKELRITRERGRWHEKAGVSIIATYHPAALLRDESKKREAWEDMKAIRARYLQIKGE